MSKNWKSFGFSCHVEQHADLIAWLEALPKSARSEAVRDQLLYALRVQGKLPTNYERGRYSTYPATSDLSEVKQMFSDVMQAIKNVTGQDFVLAERGENGELQQRDLGFSAEARDSLAARIFGDDDEE